ncbi:hypothetical protein ACWFMI_16175 [Nocardiopsis terrae]
MNDVHIPKPIVPQEWDKVDTSIDNEDPQVLSREQFMRYCTTIRDLLRAAGLPVQDFDHETPDYLIVDSDDLSMQVRLDADRLANIELTLSEDMAELPNTVQAASHLIRLFELGRAFDSSRNRLG